MKHYPEKNGFYLPFFFFASLWSLDINLDNFLNDFSALPRTDCHRFVSGPVIIFLANHIVDKWIREKMVFGVEKSIALIGFLAFLVTVLYI